MVPIDDQEFLALQKRIFKERGLNLSQYRLSALLSDIEGIEVIEELAEERTKELKVLVNVIARRVVSSRQWKQ